MRGGASGSRLERQIVPRERGLSSAAETPNSHPAGPVPSVEVARPGVGDATADRVDVQVERTLALRAARDDRRPFLAHQPAVGLEARHGFDELRGARVQQRDQRVVLQVAAHAWQLVHRGDPEHAQLVRRPDAGAHQGQGRAVGAGAEDHPASANRDRAIRADRLQPDHPAALDQEPIGEHVAADRQVGAIADRVEVGEGRVPAEPVGDDVDRVDRHPIGQVDVVQVLAHREPGAGRRLHAGLVPGRQLAPGRDAHPHLPRHRLEERQQRRCLPAGVAERRPAVVVLAVAPDGGAAVVRGAAAQHPRPLQQQPGLAVRGGARVVPAMGAHRHLASVEQPRRPAAGRVRPVIWPRLQQQHRLVGPLREPPGQGGAGRPPAHDDCIGVRWDLLALGLYHHHRASPPNGPGSRKRRRTFSVTRETLLA